MRWARVLAPVLVATVARLAIAAPEGAGAPGEHADHPRNEAGPTREGAGDPPDGEAPAGEGSADPRDTEARTGEAGGPRAGAADLHVDHSAVTPAVSPGRRAAAIAVAIFPGILVRGAGSWIVGEHRAAKRLAATGAIGAVAFVVGGLPIRVGGSSPYTIWPGVPLVVSGTGLFVASWLGDIWVAAGGARWATTAVALPPWSVEVATTWQHDAYRERALLHAAGHLELGRLGLDGAGYLDARNAFRMGEARARWRLWGAPATGRAVTAGSGLVARATARLERDDPDRVTLATAEAELLGRLALDWLDPAIRGNFLELSAGGGLSRTGYPEGRHDTEAVLVAGFAWGAYLGDRGELRLYYDHRRNGLAGGLAASHAAGFLGSFGVSTELRVLGPWAVHGELQIGDAWVTTLGVRYLGGR